ncbi:precorrin-3B synthase [Methylocystis heyeri]|uniref:Precorrin-3B synthase n=1 Tax=Methylocystis heyeri TaxID=391905 RepID=A0A6B8KAY6_9HYPH|nr:precorrin-3B synthase [Methylocystis heyeri]QGM45276.1 precorrin-3B synthase [Methylocystis heyeri]
MRSAPEIKGWCPGALAPMESGDGLLMRAKIIGSRLTLRQLREIAAIATDCGNGLIDLSQRAQLQMRGVSPATSHEAQQRLKAIGLLAADAAAESVMNVMASPIRGRDIDANEIASQLARAIEQDQALRALPGKFLFLVDDGGPLGLADIEADVRLEAKGEEIAILVAGARDIAVVLPASEAVGAAIALARAFVSLRAERRFEWRRMRAVTQALGAPAIFGAAGLEAEAYRTLTTATPIDRALGAQNAGGAFFAGVAAPFGRWRAEDMARLAETLGQEGAEELRPTPWRAMLALTPSAQSAGRIAEAAQQIGLIVDPKDARLAVVACPGAPECPQAHGPTRTDAERLAPLAARLGAGAVGLHISGCAKGCAMLSPAPAALLVREGGYDLIFDGRADAKPFAVNLSLAEVEQALAARS